MEPSWEHVVHAESIQLWSFAEGPRKESEQSNCSIVVLKASYTHSVWHDQDLSRLSPGDPHRHAVPEGPPQDFTEEQPDLLRQLVLVAI